MGIKRWFYKLLLSWIIILFSNNLTFAYDLKSYFPLGEGDNWTYSIFENGHNYKKTFSVKEKENINNIEAIKLCENEDCEYLSIDYEGVKSYKSSEDTKNEIYSPFDLLFPADMNIGEEKEHMYKHEEFDNNGNKLTEVVLVNKVILETIEDITVPAGKFKDCLKFSKISDWKKINGDYGIDEYTLWLAPDVGKIKEFCFFTEHNAETKEVTTSNELYELTSAVINGEKIGN